MAPNASTKKLLSFSDGEENGEPVDLTKLNKVTMQSRPQEDVWNSLSQKTEKFKKDVEKEDREIMERFKETGKYESSINSNEPVDKNLLNMLQHRNQKKYTHPKLVGRRLVPKPLLPNPQKKFLIENSISAPDFKKATESKDDKMIQDQKQEVATTINKAKLLPKPPVAPHKVSPVSSSLDVTPPGLSINKISDIAPPELPSSDLVTTIGPPPGLTGEEVADAPPGFTEQPPAQSAAVSNGSAVPPGLIEESPAQPPGLTEKLPLPPGLAIGSSIKAPPTDEASTSTQVKQETKSTSELAEKPTSQPVSINTDAISAQEVKSIGEPAVKSEDVKPQHISLESNVTVPEDTVKSEYWAPPANKQESPTIATSNDPPLPTRAFSRSPESGHRSPSRTHRSRSKSRRRRSQVHRSRSRSRGRVKSRSNYRKSVRSRSRSRGRRRHSRRSRSRGYRSRSRARRSRSRERRSRSRRRGRRSRSRSRSLYRGRRRRGRRSRSRSRSRVYRRGSRKRRRDRSHSRSNRYSKHNSPRGKTPGQAGATDALEEIKRIVLPTSSLPKSQPSDTLTSIPNSSSPSTTVAGVNTNVQVPQLLVGRGSAPIITLPHSIMPAVSQEPLYVNSSSGQNYLTPGVYNPNFSQLQPPVVINQIPVNKSLQSVPGVSNVLQPAIDSTNQQSIQIKPEDNAANSKLKDLNDQKSSKVADYKIRLRESDNGHDYRRRHRSSERDRRDVRRDRRSRRSRDRRSRDKRSREKRSRDMRSRDMRSRDRRSRGRRSRDIRSRDRRSRDRRSRDRRSRDRRSPPRKRKREEDQLEVDITEPSQEDFPAPVVGRDSTYVGNQGQRWEIVMQSPKLRSYACYLRNTFDSNTLKEWIRITEENADWKQPMVKGSLLPRKAAWFVAPGCKCTYKYSSTQWAPTAFPDWFQAIQTEVMKRLGIPLNNEPNSCNVNLYYSGQASVGWHSDNERIFESKFRDCLIISLSLGTTRKFQVKTVGSERIIKELLLGDGDLMTMEGLFQKHYLHRVPKEPHIEGKRLNFTWRWITAHDRDECGMRPEWCPGHWFGRGSVFEKQKLMKRFDNDASNDNKRGRYEQNPSPSSKTLEPTI